MINTLGKTILYHSTFLYVLTTWTHQLPAWYKVTETESDILVRRTAGNIACFLVIRLLKLFFVLNCCLIWSHSFWLKLLFVGLLVSYTVRSVALFRFQVRIDKVKKVLYLRTMSKHRYSVTGRPFRMAMTEFGDFMAWYNSERKLFLLIRGTQAYETIVNFLIEIKAPIEYNLGSGNQRLS